MDSLKEKFFVWGRLILIILLSSIILAEGLYFVFAVLGICIDFSVSHEKARYLLSFVIILCFCALLYLIYHIYFLKEHYVALGCSSKLSNEEYEKMKKLMTKSEVEKLTRSNEYQEYLRKSQIFNVDKRKEQAEESEEIFSSDSEKER